jgi:hypothetical protein
MKYNGGLQTFSVPNNAEGDQFYLLLKKFFNHHHYHFSTYGRGSNRKSFGNSSHIPLAKCEWYTVYITPKIIN